MDKVYHRKKYTWLINKGKYSMFFIKEKNTKTIVRPVVT